METEKIFWAFAILVAAGMVAFAASSMLVSPVYAQGAHASCGMGGAAGLAAAPAPTQQQGTLAVVKGGVQEVQLSVQGGYYSPNPVRVKKGVPVRLVADMSTVVGCSRSIVIPEFGVQKTVSAGDNVIEFTPDKSGTFSFSCSMGMYRGTLVVEEADGTVAANTGTAAPIKAGSCGGSSGGCGCGGARQ